MEDEKKSASRVEIIEEKFFPTSGFREEGTIIPAPSATVAQRDKWRDEWLKKHRRTRTPAGLILEEPRVSMGPAKREGSYGYSVTLTHPQGDIASHLSDFSPSATLRTYRNLTPSHPSLPTLLKLRGSRKLPPSLS